MPGLADLERLTKDYAGNRSILVERVQKLNDEIEAAKRKLLPGIKSAVCAVKEFEAVLRDAVEKSPELFVKPRTIIFHGVKIGFEKGKGKIDLGEIGTVIKLIRKHFPDQADVLIKVKETPVKKALSLLSAADLKKLGITVIETGDVVIIKPADSDVDKIVNALLGEKEEAEE